MDRREFIKAAGKLAVLMGLGRGAAASVAEAMAQMASGQAPVLWLQGQSCSGCSVSLLNSAPLSPATFLTKYISLKFHQTLSTATGDMAVNAANVTIEKGGFVLVVEGAVPAGMPEACIFGHEPFTQQLERAASKASAILTVGTCSSFGGIPAAENNPTGSVSAIDYLQKKGIQKPMVRIPGCPPHPDWVVGSVVHLLKFGMPELTETLAPKMFFGTALHDHCPRFADYERQNFARTFGEKGCLFKLGCQGPVTKADCTRRRWNEKTNDCIACGAGCIGCAAPHFAKRSDFAFYPRNNT